MADWLVIDEDGEIDVEEIIRQIRAHIASDDGEYRAQSHGNSDSGLLPDVMIPIEAARRAQGESFVTVDFRKSRLPILGRVIDALRQATHQLVAYYVNRSATQQALFNKHVVEALSAIAKEIASSPQDHDPATEQCTESETPQEGSATTSLK